jgi:hypothetical protein
MTIRPPSARVSSRKNGRKASLSQGAVLNISQPNSFGMQRLFTTTPDQVQVGKYIYSYDAYDASLTLPSMSVRDDVASLPFEVMQLYNKDGTLSSFSVNFTHNGVTYTYSPTSFTNNLPNVVRIPVNVARQFRGKYLTHNHPNGSSFSFDDLKFSYSQRLAGIEALPKRDAFWGSVREFNNNRQRLLQDLDNLRQKNYRNGLTSDADVVERMMRFVMQTPSNPSQPQVRFQASPLQNKSWPSSISNNPWYQAVYAKAIHDMSSFRYLSEEAKYLLTSHALNESFAERAGFRYSLVGL